jgi:hypothetical protein
MQKPHGNSNSFLKSIENPKAINWLNICTCAVAEWGTSLLLILSLLFPEILANPSHTPPPPQINVRGDRSA